MATYSTCTLMLKNFGRIGVVLIFIFMLTCASCPPRRDTSPPSIKVTEFPSYALFTNNDYPIVRNIGYTYGPSIDYTVGENHRFQVRVKVEFLTADAGFNSPDTGVTIIWINPENDKEEFAKVKPDPRPLVKNIYSFVLPGSENLDLCEAYFYRWSIVYNEGNSRAVYLGKPQFVMPYKKRTSTGAIQEALCQTPSTSPWGDL